MNQEKIDYLRSLIVDRDAKLDTWTTACDKLNGALLNEPDYYRMVRDKHAPVPEWLKDVSQKHYDYWIRHPHRNKGKRVYKASTPTKQKRALAMVDKMLGKEVTDDGDREPVRDIKPIRSW